MSRRLSGLQREVLALYRRVIIVAREKEAAGHEGFIASARAAFRQQALTTDARNFQKIEYMIRRGDKQLRVIRDPQVKSFGGVLVTANGNCAR